jgi:glycosyltransferase involved in cell wall biosynthesis
MTLQTEIPQSTPGLAAEPEKALSSSPVVPAAPSSPRLAGKRAGMVVFSPYPADPRPRRAAAALLKEGMSIDLICEGAEGFSRREQKGALDITRIPIRHYRGGALSYAAQYSTFIFLSAFILAWRMLRRKYDLIYIHNMPDILVASALLPKLMGAKVILDQHDPMPELMRTIFEKSETSFAVRVLCFLEKWSLGRADLVITVNEACRKIFSRRSCRLDKIAVVMNCPDGEIFPYRSARSYAARTPDRPFVIMYHGSLVERNGVELAVEALARIHKTIPAAELRIYGKSSAYLERVMEKAGRLGLQDHVRYLGPKKLEELVGEIESSDVGVIPNQRNIFTDINTPTRIFEYLALGKPVIAPSTPGIEDYFSADSLLFFESGNAEQLAAKMEYAALHPLEMIDIAGRGQQIYLAHTWQQEKETLVRAVSELIGKGRSN